MKKDELYAKLLERRVVKTDEIVELAEGIVSNPTKKYIQKKYISPLLKEEKLVRIKRGLYAALNPLDDPSTFMPDRFLIGSKIRTQGFLGYHTALEFYGHAHSSIYNTTYVCLPHSQRFENFSFRGIQFKPVFVQKVKTGINKEKHLGQSVKVTDRERTFIDCLDRIKYAGGWEECLKSLESFRGLDFDRLVKYAQGYGNEFLLRKIGFILEFLKESSAFYEHLKEKHLKKLTRKISGQPRYLEGVRESNEQPLLNEKWNLYIFPDFEQRFLRGI